MIGKFDQETLSDEQQKSKWLSQLCLESNPMLEPVIINGHSHNY